MKTETTKFSELGLAEPFLRSTESLGYEHATPIQAQAIPVILEGRDLVGCAQTGTGKTAAFTLPMLDLLLQKLPPKPTGPRPKPQHRKGPKGAKGANPRPRTLRALVLAPTRELSAQIGDSLKRYGKHTPLRHALVFGGVSQVPQVRTLRHGVDTLVATPGRLLDLMNQGHINLSKVDILVLDEADQMLDMGFLPDLKRIIAKVPEQRQTLMFSATMPPAIRKLAEEWLSDPVNIQVAPVATPAERIAQSVHMVDKKKKPERLVKFLHDTPRQRTLVFSRTKHGADKIVKRLNADGLRAAAIHGNKSQGARTRTLEQFKSQNPPILVATDIAARGLDVRNVSHIVNYDLPETPETYVHRIGRTARAGAEGTAISFCSNDERKLLRAIERLMNFRIEVDPSSDLAEPPARQVSDDSPRRGSKQGKFNSKNRRRPFKSGERNGKPGEQNGKPGKRNDKPGGKRDQYGNRIAPPSEGSGNSGQGNSGNDKFGEGITTSDERPRRPKRQLSEQSGKPGEGTSQGKRKRKYKPTESAGGGPKRKPNRFKRKPKATKQSQ
ncbi:DEAD/DEAH box helicase [Aeoliella sp. ICT_H6.2]|uniref:DEAD-box ATP-dependent RNA helicase RhpA n=1 Tax=Aeoliella straminimaris TaxID=2954799 RepID=A0A9X2FHL4_9BACT|nr:DEAD/DEAH box helicase [Aeoliella straminimaris]MCO6046206.1 DEAD/DEAH box helicase [Aeoliella straminimaris]